MAAPKENVAHEERRLHLSCFGEKKGLQFTQLFVFS